MQETFSSRESCYVVQKFLNGFINQKVLRQVKQKVELEIMNKKISTQGVKQSTKLIFPKVFNEIEAQHSGFWQKKSNPDCEEAQFNPKTSLKRMYRKSCDDIKSFRQSQTSQTSNRNKLWLKQAIKNRKQVQQFQRNVALQSEDRSHSQKSIYSKFHTKKVQLFNSTRFQETNESFHHTKSKLRLDNNLIRISNQVQKQDEQIVRKRENLLKKKQIQKQFEDTFSKLKSQVKASLPGSQLISQTVSPSYSFTTDYNGEIIQFQGQQKCKKKSTFRKVTISKANLKDRKFETVQNSPCKSKPKIETKSQSQQKLIKSEENDLPLKQKIKIKFKIKKQNIIETFIAPSTKNIQFQVMYDKKGQNSSDSNDTNRNTLQGNNKSQLKSSRCLPSLDQNYILKSIELSPGVTVDNFHSSRQQKENETCGRLVTTKSIGKSLKSFKSIKQLVVNSQHEPTTLKSIMMSKRFIKGQENGSFEGNLSRKQHRATKPPRQVSFMQSIVNA